MPESRRWVVAPEARDDLENIWLEIAKDNPRAADAFVGDIGRQMEKLALLDVKGAPRDWVKPGIRAFPYRERCFYFRITKEAIILLRVLHGRQDVSAAEFP